MTDFSTRAVHGPEDDESRPVLPHGVPIQQTTSFEFPGVEEGIAAFRGSGAYLYTRKANPTIRALERHVAALESVPVETPDGPRSPPGDVDSRFFTSGMAAIGSTAIALAAGGRIVCQGGIYGTTEAMMGRLRSLGIRVDFAPVGDLDALADAIRGGPAPALVHVETPANPLLQVTDIEAAAGLAHEAGAALAVDATFASPALLRPLCWGADLALHSTTKFMSGHGVVLGGIVSGAPDLVSNAIEPWRTDLGGSADPFAAWLTLLGLRTLSVRMDRQADNADAVAAWLAGHPRVTRVYRPDPGRLPAGQMERGGPMLSFEVEGGEEAALAMLDRLELITLTPTLGNLDTLVQHPWSMSHVVLPEARRREMGIGPGVVRVSIGIEAAEDLIEDLGRALA